MRQNPAQIIPEDAIVDYMGCPLRYAFLWYYDVDVPEGQRGYREHTRSGLSVLFRLVHEKRLTNRTLQEGLDQVGLDEPTQVFVWPALLKYALEMRRRQVLAYDIPIQKRVASFRFVSAIDALCVREDKLIGLKFVAIPWMFDLALESAIMGLVQLCLPVDVREEAKRRGLELEWRTVKLRGPRVIETVVEEQEHPATICVSVARALSAHAFYPRWPKSLCRRCGFLKICRPAWATGRAFRKRHETRAQIIEELTSAGTEVRNP